MTTTAQALADLAAQYATRWRTLIPHGLVTHLATRGPVWDSTQARRWLQRANDRDYRPTGRALRALRIALRLNQREAGRMLRLPDVGHLEGQVTDPLPRRLDERLRVALLLCAIQSLPPDTPPAGDLHA